MNHVLELARQHLSFKEVEKLYQEKLNEGRVIPMNDEKKQINEFAQNMLNRNRGIHRNKDRNLADE